jgi:hypothetical protein
MSIIKLDGEAHPISEKVGDYIDLLVEDKRSQKVKLNSIAEMAKSWLESDCNTVDKAKEKVAFSFILDLTKDKV